MAGEIRPAEQGPSSEACPDRGQDSRGGADDSDAAAASYEQSHVHAVYDAIADHFSATRYAPWPLVARFLAAQPPGAVGLDVGCGNGKYLGPAAGAQSFILGSDRSAALARLAYDKHARRAAGTAGAADVLLADSLALPFRGACADFAICIAVVHHLSTRARRQAAVAELLRCVRGEAGSGERREGISAGSASENELGGRVLLYVWALEQASSRRGWTADGEQDLLVPWVKTTKTARAKEEAGRETKQRQQRAVGRRSQSRQIQKQEEEQQECSQETPGEETEARQPPPPPPTFHRYYHLYREGELEADVAAAGGRVVASGYERDNWWVVANPV